MEILIYANEVVKTGIEKIINGYKILKRSKNHQPFLLKICNLIRQYASSQTISRIIENDFLDFAPANATTDATNGHINTNFVVSIEDHAILQNYCDSSQKYNVGREIFINTKRIASLPDLK